jgi:predicted GTPase
MGYGEQQLKDLEKTINNTDCDSVIIATLIDLNRIIRSKAQYQGIL